VRRKGPKPETIEAVPMWVVAPGGIGHAVRSRNPTVARCGMTGFMGGHFTAATPSKLCAGCRESLGFTEVIPDKPAPAPVPPSTQGLLF
jgi:hypothetical protein